MGFMNSYLPLLYIVFCPCSLGQYLIETILKMQVTVCSGFSEHGTYHVEFNATNIK